MLEPLLEADADAGAGVEVVAEGVSDEVEAEDAEHDGDGGEDDQVGGVEEVGAGVVEHGSPACDGGRDAESEEAESGLSQHCAGHADGGLHDERLDDVGQDVAEEDAEVAGTEGAGGFDEFALAYREHLTADQAGVADPSADGEGEDEVEQAGSEEGDEGDGEQDSGEGHEGVHGEDVERGIDCASVKAGDAAENDSGGEREGHDGNGDGEREARAEDDAGEDVSAEGVGAKPMGGAGRGEAMQQVDGGWIVRGEPWGEQRHGREEDKQGDSQGGERLREDAARDAHACSYFNCRRGKKWAQSELRRGIGDTLGHPQFYIFSAVRSMGRMGSVLRLLFLGLNYTPELTGIGKYSGEMMEWLASRGHEVHVVTAPPYYPAWRVSKGYSQWRYRRERSAAGVEIYRCPLWVPRNPKGGTRVTHLSSFALSSLPVMLAQVAWHPDLVLTVEPAFACAPVALLVARLCGAPTWLHVQDFEVDAAFELGLLPSGGWAHELAQSCEDIIRSGFSQFSTISQSMMARLEQKGIESERITFFPNWVDVEAIRPLDGPNALRAELGIGQDDVALLYSGNMGAKQGLEILPQLAERLRDHAHLRFVFCGDGVYREQLEQGVAGLTNVTFLPLQPLERLNELLNLADIHLLPQRAGAADLVMPSKLTGMLASGRPVIATAAPETQIASAVEGHGIVVAPGDVEAMAQAAVLLAENAALRKRMGNAARGFAVRDLARDPVLLRFESALSGALVGVPMSAIAESGA